MNAPYWLRWGIWTRAPRQSEAQRAVAKRGISIVGARCQQPLTDEQRAAVQLVTRSALNRALRHCVATSATGWRCIDCGETFTTWPSDDQACPGGVA